jgi:integrase
MVRAAEPNPEKRLEIPDKLVTGLYLVVTPNGAKSWAVRFRFAGKPKKLTLGQYPELPLATARDMAKEALIKIAKGADPTAEKAERINAEKSLKEAAERDVRDRFDNIAAEFYERYLKPRNRSADETRKIIDRLLLPEWGQRNITTIDRRDVIKLLDGLVDRGTPIMANRALALVRKLFNWAIERGILLNNPASAVKAPGKERKRERVLKDAELKSIWNAAAALKWPFEPMVKLLLLTGQRRDEVSCMRWRDVDLESAIWTIPAEVAKNGKVHIVPLPRRALDIIRGLPRVGDAYVFTTTGKTAVSGFSRFKTKLDNESEVTDWTLHDLRRTMATGLQRLGVRLEVTEAVLNHVSGSRAGIVGVYQRHDFADEKRAALEAWAAHIDRLLNPADTAANVIELPKRA